MDTFTDIMNGVHDHIRQCQSGLIVFIAFHFLMFLPNDLINTPHEDSVGLVHLRVRSNGHIVNVNIRKGFPDNSLILY